MLVTQIQKRTAECERLHDTELTRVATQLREQVNRNGDALTEPALIEGCALAREAVRRTTGRCLYPVQLLAGIVLAEGAIAEMQTGEGKTLTSAIPGFLNSLRFPSVHVATPNAYLAERDCHELRPAYEMLGLRVGLLPEKHEHTKNRLAYQCDITYGTGYEFGFDFLRDQLAEMQRPTLSLGTQTLLSLRGQSLPAANAVQSGHHCALVDEIDSVLLDEAMTPLIMSVPVRQAEVGDLLHRVALQTSDRLVRGEHFVLDHAARTVRLNPVGVQQSFAWLATPEGLGLVARNDLAQGLKRPWTQYVEQALYARYLLQSDVDYVVRAGKVEIVDQRTGRIFSERSWRAGLHQAVEMREGVPLSDEKTSAARITRQRYFQLYRSLGGMTGTATGADAEFREFYRLRIAVIPLNQPTKRQLLPDLFFESTDAKFAAIAQETVAAHRRGQPVLIGARTIIDSQRLSELLTARKTPHLVLNGKQDQSEAEIIGQAGHYGQVTIATNMAGRGTDIQPDARGLAVGGLHVLGCERYESRRIDRQLAGRAARAGAPGSARFYLSAEDELLSHHAPRLAKRLRATAGRDGLSAASVARAIAALQATREADGFQTRRRMMQQDRWWEDIVDSLRREHAKAS